MATPSTTPEPRTFDNAVDVSTHGYKWILDADRTINWSISDGFVDSNGLFYVWSDPAKVIASVEMAFEAFSYYADVTFEYVGYYGDPELAALAGSDINISLNVASPSIWGWANFPTSTANTDYVGQSGDVYLNVNSPANYLPSYEPGSAGWYLLIHELGHALGLKHTHDDGGTGRPTMSDLGLGQLDRDWMSIMSYKDDYDFDLVAFDPATPMLLDVIGLQYTYGINRTTNAGNDIHSLTNSNLYYTVWDAAGVDEVSAAGATTGWIIYLPNEVVSPLVGERWGSARPINEFDLPSPSTFVWLEGDIENAYGSGFADDILGNDLANVLSGAAGADTLVGAGGDDWLWGGMGRDVMTGGAGADYFDFNKAKETGTASTTRDVILDFTHLMDVIDLKTIDASSKLSSNNAFVWKGTGAFTTSTKGELRFKQFDNDGTENDYTIIYGDTDADKASEFQIELEGLVSLTKSDFLL